MFGNAKLKIKNHELEEELEKYKRELHRVEILKQRIQMEYEAFRCSDCSHSYQLVCAVLHPVSIALSETNGLLSTNTFGDVTHCLTHHLDVNIDDDEDNTRMAIYARICTLCHHTLPASCFDVAASAGAAWSKFHLESAEDIEYLKCVEIKKPTSRLDEILIGDETP